MEPQSPPPLPQQRQTPSATWWQRNWKWFIPVCIGSVVLFVGFIMLIFVAVFGMMKSSDAYKDALAMAQENQYVQEALGPPIEPGLLVMGNIRVNGSSGHADLKIPVSGQYGEGTIYAVASKSAGRWTMLQLVIDIKATNERIDLLAADLDHRS